PDGEHLQSGSSKPCGDAGGVHSIIQADRVSRGGLISALALTARSWRRKELPLSITHQDGREMESGTNIAKSDDWRTKCEKLEL
ncbi:hypothetical protein OS176_13515, partial [Xanthomonadaceae bacterium XH05]|nr:hypothetical protein [Xanthomonadaceae bacterium XH05]